MTAILARQIRAQCTDWDVDHGTASCRLGPGCIHQAVTALRTVVAVHNPRPDGGCWSCGPGECSTLYYIAEALGLHAEPSSAAPENGDEYPPLVDATAELADPPEAT